MLVRPFQQNDTSVVVQLWQRCGLIRPWNNPYLDIQRKLETQPDWLLVGLINGVIVASVMVGDEGHRGWINYLAVEPSYQRRGLARQLMLTAEQHLLSVGCPKINLQIRIDNIAASEFYESLGFTQDQAVCYGKRLIQDDADHTTANPWS